MNGILTRGLATSAAHCTLITASLCGPAMAQSPALPDREAVLAVVQGFFDTMAMKDVAGARRLVIPEGTFSSMRMLDGKPVLRTSTIQSYLDNLPGEKQRLRERIWNPEVRIQGAVATVWAPYDFWRDGAFSHCGVDAFDLVKTPDGWRIGGGAYTVESDCEASPLGPLAEQARPT